MHIKIIKISAMLVTLAAIIFIVQGCYYDKEELLYHKVGTTDCTIISAKFSTDVLPIMQTKCAISGCHNAAGNAGGDVLETYTEISGLAARINQRCIIDQTMPPGGALSPADMAVLSCWINAGAPNN